MVSFPDSASWLLYRETERRKRNAQKAVRLYLHVSEKESLQQLLKEGYIEMASEAREVTQAFELLDREALKHAD